MVFASMLLVIAFMPPYLNPSVIIFLFFSLKRKRTLMHANCVALHMCAYNKLQFLEHFLIYVDMNCRRGSGGRGFISGAGETELQLQRRRLILDTSSIIFLRRH